jgi:hypothetical protein
MPTITRDRRSLLDDDEDDDVEEVTPPPPQPTLELDEVPRNTDLTTTIWRMVHGGDYEGMSQLLTQHPGNSSPLCCIALVIAMPLLTCG